MERIRNALEQAERDRSELNVRKSEPASATAVANSVQEVRRTPDSTDTAEVRYSRTKTISVSPELLEANRIVSALPNHELTDAYRVLRTRVLQSLNAHKWNSVAITSPATGSGKTLTAINLAISLAREVNRTVLLADFDLRQPSIHKYFGYEPEVGLSDYLFGDAVIEDILFSPSIDRLAILPGRESVHNSSEMLRSPKMEGLVEEMKGRYADRLVLFDLPPLLALDDALAFSPYTDSILMVAENGATTRDDLQKALEMLKDAPLIGTVLNKVDSSTSYNYASKKK